jgi:hypothetical protein
MSYGVTVTTQTAPPTAGAPTNTGSLFVAGNPGTATAPTAAVLCSSTADYEAAFGVRGTPAANIQLWDYLDFYFREGGQQAYVGGYITADTYTAGLNLFTKKLGPGQVAICDASLTPTATVYSDLAEAAVNNNRVALADCPQTANTLTALESFGAMLPADPTAEYIGLWGGWCDGPGPAGVVGAGPRTVPASAVIAALCNRVDQLGNPNRMAAGRDFPLQYVTGFTYDPDMSDRVSLLGTGVNTLGQIYGVLENYGFQSPIKRSDTTPFWQLNCARARMWLTAQADAAGENYMFVPIDALGSATGDLQSDLLALCLQLYNVNGLYGATPQDAYNVIVTGTVNTDATAAQAELNAVLEARLAMGTVAVNIQLVSVPVLGAVT